MIIRNKELILYIVGFGLSIAIVLNGAWLVDKWKTYSIHRQPNSGFYYSYIISMQSDEESVGAGVTDENEYSRCIEKLVSYADNVEKPNCTIYVRDLPATIGDSAETISINIILGSKIEWYRDLSEGTYALKQNEMKGVFIGKDVERFTYVRDDKKYIQINNEAYEVIGTFQDYGMDDEEICVYVQTISESIIRNILHRLNSRFDCCVCVGSDEEDVADAATDIYNILGSLDNTAIDMFECNNIAGTNINSYYTKIYKWILIIIFGMSLVNIWQLTQLWLAKKEQAIIIMKTYGMNTISITKRIIPELMNSFGIATVVFGIPGIGIMWHFSSTQRLELALVNGLVCIIASFLIIFIIILYGIIVKCNKTIVQGGYETE